MTDSGAPFSGEELYEAWPVLLDEDRVEAFQLLRREDAENLFFKLNSQDEAILILALPAGERRGWIRLLPPDDVADLLQQIDGKQRDAILALLDDATRREVSALLAYDEDAAGGLMNPRFARLRPDMSVDEAISYLRRQTRENIETIYYAYVQDVEQRLLGVVSFRELFAATPDKHVRDVMHRDVVTVPAEMDQEAVSHLFAANDLLALPVVDADGRMKGIVTADDIVDVVKEEATEDIQKIGGVEALNTPYLQTAVPEMITKRVLWLCVLFMGQTFTLTAMEHFQAQISRAEVLVLFLPLILSSGGNSGSQASTLVIRALALGEVRLRDWLLILRREVVIGVSLGAILGALGFVRFLLGASVHDYGVQALRIGLAITLSLVAVVLWGTLAGSMLPLLLRRIGLDPATASTPFVATLCDVTGIMIYFGLSTVILSIA